MVNIVRSVKVIKPDDGVINTNTGDSFKINFCPMCGRKLS